MKQSRAKALLDSFIDVARSELKLNDQDMIEAMIEYHERYAERPEGAQIQRWRKDVIAVLRRAKHELETLA